MSNHHKALCEYCGTSPVLRGYADGECPGCGAKYHWHYVDFMPDHLVWTPNRKLYVASTLANWYLVRRLFAFFRDFEICPAFDWTSFGEEISNNPGDRDKEYKSLAQKATSELDGVLSCSHFLLLMPANRGAHFEFGVAYLKLRNRLKAAITVVDEPNTQSPVSFHHLPNVFYTTSLYNGVAHVLATMSKLTDLTHIKCTLERYLC